MTAISAVGQPKKAKKRKLRLFWRQRHLQTMVLIGAVFVLVFSYLPMYGIIMAFQEYELGDQPGFSIWVGLRHFKSLLTDPMFPTILRNTMVISILKLVFTFPAPILLALLMNEVAGKRFKKVVSTVSYLPHFISWVVAAGLITDMLRVDGGAINELLMSVGILKEPFYFMGSQAFFWPLTVLSELWKEIGWGSIIYVSAITSIDSTLYEAADMDGAGRFAKMWYITLASIKPTIIIMFIFAVGGLLNANFDQLMMLTNQMNNTLLIDVADVVDTYVYRVGVNLSRFSYATAVGLLKSLVNFILLFGANYLANKLGEDGVV